MTFGNHRRRVTSPAPVLMWIYAGNSGVMGICMFLVAAKVLVTSHGYERLMVIPFGISAVFFCFFAFGFSVMALDDRKQP